MIAFRTGFSSYLEKISEENLFNDLVNKGKNLIGGGNNQSNNMPANPQNNQPQVPVKATTNNAPISNSVNPMSSMIAGMMLGAIKTPEFKTGAKTELTSILQDPDLQKSLKGMLQGQITGLMDSPELKKSLQSFLSGQVSGLMSDPNLKKSMSSTITPMLDKLKSGLQKQMMPLYLTSLASPFLANMLMGGNNKGQMSPGNMTQPIMPGSNPYNSYRWSQ